MIPEDMPGWATSLISAIIGAGGVAFFRVWLENRRLTRKDFRETLLDRVRELEGVVSQLQMRMGSLRVEMAHLDVENRSLLTQIELLKREDDVDDTGSEGHDA